MRIVDEILVYNEKFVADKKFEKFETTKFPEKRLVILSCMDTRLVELLPRAMNFRNGDVKIVKSGGAIVAHPFGSIMRSILVAVYELNADEICVVGHHDCGMSKLNAESFLSKAVERGIKAETVETLKYSGIDLQQWLKGFDKVEDSVRDSVNTIKNHPLLAKNIPVHGLVIDPATGKLDMLVNGYEE